MDPTFLLYHLESLNLNKMLSIAIYSQYQQNISQPSFFSRIPTSHKPIIFNYIEIVLAKLRRNKNFTNGETSRCKGIDNLSFTHTNIYIYIYIYI